MSLSKTIAFLSAGALACLLCVILISILDPDVFVPKQYIDPNQHLKSNTPAMRAPSPSNLKIHREYIVGEQLNKNKTGSVVLIHVEPDDEFYIFVRDFKRSASKPIWLCHLNYTSTQGSYSPKWSKDKRMIAVFDESSLVLPEMKLPQWVTGYDWKRSRILKSDEIVQAFAIHGGVGSITEFRGSHTPSSQELKQFEPQKIYEERGP
ncbi:hypothetical protein B1R32_105166 [Abditibacterium utsteinense]|uniref:Uncharacterized protein n=2 Tax=Abditibacterium utsteinense TaxID=1960156 RepID=A0A2S8SUM3_9BACT|nr:hypothetical protein B1R32_105166 [Abditibacterium utsteinense]